MTMPLVIDIIIIIIIIVYIIVKTSISKLFVELGLHNFNVAAKVFL